MPLTDDTQLVSVDDHIVEPPHVWETYLPAGQRDRGPRIVELDADETGGRVQAWLLDGETHPLNFQGNAATRRFRSEQGKGDDLYARAYDDMIAGAYDVHERVRCMDEDGVAVELPFPTFPRFAGTRFIPLAETDPELALGCVRAYNDWMLDEWCAAYPERFIPQVLIPLWDIAASVAEMERTADKGARSIAFCENPHGVGLPSFPTGHWGPVFDAAQNLDLVLSCHIGTSGKLPRVSPETSPSVGIALCGINSQLACGDLIFSGELEKYPRVRFALSEGGAGWVPYALERLDYTWDRSRYEGIDRIETPPSEQFQRNIWVCVIHDEVAIKNRHDIGVDKIMWECDFPHNDSNWPNSRKLLAETLRDVPDDESQRIAEGNARELYRFPR